MAKQYNFDNIYSVASLFVRSKMYELLTNENDYVNIAFNFEEQEARCFLKSIAKTDEYVTKEVRDFLLSAIDNVDYSINVINVPDYKEFFSLLYEYANKYKDDGRENAIATNVDFSFNYLWIRMTPDDFNDVIGFLRKNVAMLEDKTFEKYKDEVSIDDSSFYEDQIVFAHNSRAYLYDESNNEMRFVISDGKNNYCLPIVRYDIYEQNGVKICQIGSIQDKYNNSNKRYYKDYYKAINRLKYKVNDGVDEELTKDIEPSKLISLLLFVKLLYKHGIKDYSIPSMYVLDYEFHEKADKRIKYNFESKWTDNLKKISALRYEECYKEYLSKINKQDFISKTKTTDFIKLFERLMYHIQDVDIISYPMETSSFFNFRINSLDKVQDEPIKKILTK